MENNDYFKVKFSKLKIHFTYVCIILVSGIILILSYKTGTDTNLLNYLSFALTISSIILSILAIIQALLSNSELSNHMGKINGASDDLKKVSCDLQSATQELKQDTIDLRKQISSFPEALERIEHIQQETRDKLDEISQNRRNIENDSQTIEDVTTLYEMFLNNTSILTLLGLYAVILSSNTQKTIDLKSLFEDNSNMSYVYGALINCASFLLLNMVRTNANDNFIFNIDYINKDVLDLEKIKSKIEESAKAISLTELTNQNLSKIDAYFQS